MVTTMRIDDDVKKDSEMVLSDLGLTMTAAVTLFLRQVIKQRAIPFVISCDRRPIPEYAERREARLSERGYALAAMVDQMRKANEREMTLDEINAEIAAVRRERNARKTVVR